MEELEAKLSQFVVAASVCQVDHRALADDIDSSRDTANKLTKKLEPGHRSADPFLPWFYAFLKEWNRRCFARCLASAENRSLKTDREWSLWFGGFEVLWTIGCDITRITRFNEMREGLSKTVAAERPSEADTAEIWRWHNQDEERLDEAARRMVALYQEDQKKAFAQTMVQPKKHNSTSVTGRLRRLMFK